MQGAHRKLQIFFVHHHGYLDLRGRDHADVDAFPGQGLKHLAGDARVGAHAYAHDRDLDDVVVTFHLTCAHLLGGTLDDLQSLVVVVAVYGEGKVGETVLADILHDHVHLDIRFGDGAEDTIRHAGLVGHPDHSKLG